MAETNAGKRIQEIVATLLRAAVELNQGDVDGAKHTAAGLRLIKRANVALTGLRVGLESASGPKALAKRRR